jgi:hypothetical protein
MIPLSVIRLPASSQPRQGYMFFNPGVCLLVSLPPYLAQFPVGGPSVSGTQFLAQFGAKFQSQLGASWDLVSWDPRE